MHKLNLFTISGITIIITYIPLMYFVVRALKENKRLLPYLLHLLSVFLWGAGTIWVGVTNDCALMDVFWKFIFPPVIFIPIFFYLAILKLNDINRPLLVKFLYAWGIIFTLLSFNGLLLSPSKEWFDSLCYSTNPNFLYTTNYIIWNLIIVAAHIDLVICYKKSIHKKQNFFLLVVAPIGFIGGCTNFLLVYDIPFYPIGNFFISLYSVLCTYAILRHEFLDIKVIIRKGLIYSALVSLMTLAYVLVIVVTESLLQNIFGYQSVLIKVLTAFSFGLFLIPLRNQIQKFVDHYFFKGSPEELSEKIEKYSAQAQESDKYKMAAKLAGNVAHEIKNPLTAINTFIQQFPEKKDDPEFVRKFHALASSELERIKQLSYQLMDFAKPADIKLSTFDLHQIMDDVLLLTNERLKKNKITINTQFSNEPITLTGDKDQLKQVFLNLILNAADAMESGGNLTVTTAFVGADLRGLSPNGDRPVEGQTHRSAPTDNHNIQISISDTGCGISPDNLKKLFEPFFTTKKDGTGLGLSICKRIIETHGGRIDVESKINKGTSFLITLPHTHSGGLNA